MELQQDLGVTKEAMDFYPVLQLVDNQVLVLEKEDLVAVQEHTRTIQAVEPVDQTVDLQVELEDQVEEVEVVVVEQI